MGRDFGNGLGKVEIAAVLGGFGIVLCGFGYLGRNAAGAVDAAKVIAHRGALADALGYDVARTLQGFLYRGNLPFHKLLRIPLRIPGLAVPQKIGQRFQAFGHRHRGTGFTLGTIR